MPPHAPDGETRTSRVVGSVGFVRPKLPADDANAAADGDAQLVTLAGTRCSMPYTIKCAASSFRPTIVDPDVASVRMEQIVDGVFAECEARLSNFNPDSEVNAVNGLGSTDETHVMSDALREVVLCSKELVKMTRGAFDPSVAPLLAHYEDMAGRSASRARLVAANGTASTGDSTGSASASTPLPPIAERSDSAPASEDNDGEDEDEGGEEEGGETERGDVDVETIRRQRVVVDYWRSLLSAGFAGDPADTRVTRSVRRLLDVGQWANAFSVGVEAGTDDAGGVGDLQSPRGKLRPWRGMSEARRGGGSGPSGPSGEEEQVVKIRKKHVDARLDLSGIAKGWAVDKIAEALPSPCYVEWGGDVKVRGRHPSGRNWVVAVPEPPTLPELRTRAARAKRAGQVGPVLILADEHQKDEEAKKANKGEREYLAILELKDGEAVATSGDYESEWS
jgi:thiamine biosynthesis lipoprotein ApbE